MLTSLKLNARKTWVEICLVGAGALLLISCAVAKEGNSATEGAVSLTCARRAWLLGPGENATLKWTAEGKIPAGTSLDHVEINYDNQAELFFEDTGGLAVSSESELSADYVAPMVVTSKVERIEIVGRAMGMTGVCVVYLSPDSASPVVAVSPADLETSDNRLFPYPVGSLYAKPTDANQLEPVNPSLPFIDFSKLLPTKTLLFRKFDFANRGAELFGNVAGTDVNFALQITGQVTVPTGEEYEFALNSDDGSRLEVDGRGLIANDLVHGQTQVAGKVVLTVGPHAFRLRYFQGTGNKALQWRWRNSLNQFEAVPASAFEQPTL